MVFSVHHRFLVCTYWCMATNLHYHFKIAKYPFCLFFHLVDIQWRTFILNLSCIFDYVLLLLGISGLSRCRFVHWMPTLTLVKMGVVSKQLSIQTFKFTLGQLLACLSLCVYGMRFIVKLLCQSSQLGTIFLQVEWCCYVSPAFPPGM